MFLLSGNRRPFSQNLLWHVTFIKEQVWILSGSRYCSCCLTVTLSGFTGAEPLSLLIVTPACYVGCDKGLFLLKQSSNTAKWTNHRRFWGVPVGLMHSACTYVDIAPQVLSRFSAEAKIKLNSLWPILESPPLYTDVDIGRNHLLSRLTGGTTMPPIPCLRVLYGTVRQHSHLEHAV